jgi:NAD(P)-dependent dehydrogenase (short-subunit alcohol dehydrogenase family)
MNKIILITGASSGFGKAAAELFSQRGYTVYGTSRKAQQSDTIHFLQMDVRDADSVKAGVKELVDREGRLDIVVNNAGMGIGGSLEMATQEEIRLQMDTNFMGCVNVCQQVLPVMRKQGAGRIINLSSIGGIMGLPYQGFYSASKFAIEGFSEALSAEVRRFGILVSMVEPGDFATGFTASRKISTLTAQSDAYGESFTRSQKIIEDEENGGLKPAVLANKIVKIAESKRPKLRYVVSDFEQLLSVILKRIVPGNQFVNILRNYYKV